MSIPSNDPTVPSSPTPVPAKFIVQGLKLLLLVAGAFGIALPSYLSDDGTIQTIAGSLSLFIGAGWQLYGIFQHGQEVHAAAVASARMGTPVQVVRRAA